MTDKIGIDFHGVISSNPDLFQQFSKEIRKLGIKVYIISGGPEKEIEKYLKEHQIEYDTIWAILDYYEKKGEVKYYDDGSYQVDTKLWNEAKANYCQQENILFHIDDSNIYGKYFITPYCQYDMKEQSCSLEGLTLDFRYAKKAAQILAKYLQER